MLLPVTRAGFIIGALNVLKALSSQVLIYREVYNISYTCEMVPALKDTY